MKPIAGEPWSFKSFTGITTCGGGGGAFTLPRSINLPGFTSNTFVRFGLSGSQKQ